MNRRPRKNVAGWMKTVLAIAPLLVAGATFAASKGEFRQHDAHEHGHGTVDIVVEGEELVVEIRIPAVNVVGFEHAPRDDAERERVRTALMPFRDASSVIGLPPDAECEIEETEAVLFSMDRDEHHDGDARHDDEEHDDEEHAKEAERHEDHAKEDDDDHAEHAADADGEAHSELHASYHFHCHAPERLARIEVLAFEHLHDAEELEVRIVTPAMQSATELHTGETVVDLVP